MKDVKKAGTCIERANAGFTSFSGKYGVRMDEGRHIVLVQQPLSVGSKRIEN
jgi:hypothetical protein